MLFSGTVFLYLFLPVVLFCNRVLLRKNRNQQNVFLLIASLWFYAWGEPRFVVVMMASILANWFFGLQVHKKRNDVKASKIILAACAVFNIGVLFVFKYLSFTAKCIEELLSVSLNLPKIALPIGISFFTFQGMSYVIDVYRGNGKVQTNLIPVGLYLSFFPQLIAGPIVRYETIAEEIENRRETEQDLFEGFARFVAGLAKKVLLANRFAVLADQAFSAVNRGEPITVLFSWLGAFAYCLQIYFDFSGYSDMAIGLGRMFGFHFQENFRYPYMSCSVTEFWRRWHISLGTWFRDYLYIPLGGSRRGTGRNLFNLFVVWVLTGLWHGANWTFLVWGLMYFILLAFERKTGIYKRRGKHFHLGMWLYTQFFVLLGFVVFRAESLGVAGRYLSAMFGLCGNGLSDKGSVAWLQQYGILLCIGLILCTPLLDELSANAEEKPILRWAKAACLMVLFVISVATLVGSAYNPFIYFNF